MKAIFILMTITIVLFSVGCDKKSEDNSNNKNNGLHQYGMREGSCYDYTDNVYTASINCNNNAYGYNNNFVMQNGQCYSRNGQLVAIENCTNFDDNDNGYGGGYNGGGYNGGGYNGGGYGGGNCGGNQSNCCSRSCYGNYIYTGSGYPQQGICYGSNCRGFMLLEVATGHYVNCQ
jgi:hypothetical protein